MADVRLNLGLEPFPALAWDFANPGAGPQPFLTFGPAPFNPAPFNPAPYNPAPYNPAPYNLPPDLPERQPPQGGEEEDEGVGCVQVQRPPSRYELCSVCNLQLGSAQQAQVHYTSRYHQRRLKQTGGGCQGTVAPQTLHARPPMPLQHPAGLKSFLPFPGEGAPTRLSLFHNFPNMDPVQKAVINHTFGMTPAPRKRQIITCSLCQIRFNSQNQADAHFQGTKHGRRLRAMESGKVKMESGKVKMESGKVKMESGKVKMESGKVKKVADSPGGGATRQGAPQEAPEGAAEEQQQQQQLQQQQQPLCNNNSISSIMSNASPPLPPPPPTTTSSTSTPSPTSSPAPPNDLPKGPDPPARGFSPHAEPLPPAGVSTLGSPAAGVPKAESEEEKAKRLLYCALCKVAVNSQSQLEAHYKGAKHKVMMEVQSGGGTIRACMRPAGGRGGVGRGAGAEPGAEPGGGVVQLTRAFRCELCDVVVNSESQLKQHVTSRRHKDKLAGKPPKQKLGPYSRAARKPTHSQHPRPSKLSFPKELATSLNGGYLLAPLHPSSALASGMAHGKMSFAKEPLKTLAPPGFLGPPLTAAGAAVAAAAAAAAAASPLHAAFTLRPGPPAFIRGPAFLPALLRPAPGPLRTPHGHFVFAPY
ncbi:zinc finger protein 385D-like isoform X1 [Petromyzon marinus]|uniref:zinc finger protein 385D-like isoform X1 n=1 Tax=Petromyzon marinus TaxID=7757 RepID=UPI003F6E79C0